MSRTFELSQDGRQLFETLHIANGRSDTPIIIRYVYDIASSDTKSEQDSDPNRPVLKRNPDDGASPNNSNTQSGQFAQSFYAAAPTEMSRPRHYFTGASNVPQSSTDGTRNSTDAECARAFRR